MEAIVAAIGNVDGKRRLRQRGDGVRKFYQQATVRRQNLSCEAPVPLDWTFLSEVGVIPAPTEIGARCRCVLVTGRESDTHPKSRALDRRCTDPRNPKTDPCRVIGLPCS